MINELIGRYPALAGCREDIEKAASLVTQTYKEGGKILLCGNGGSAADCEHIAGELLKGFLKKRRVTDERLPVHLREKLQGALPAISLPSQTAALTAFINDVCAETAFAQLVYGYGRDKDLLIAISTSGNSKNVVAAAETAKCLGLRVLALTGKKESRLSAIADVTVKAPETETYKVQELHLPIYHYICARTEQDIFGDD